MENSKFRKYFVNEVTAAIAIVGITVGCVTWIKSPNDEMAVRTALIEQKISIIESNHLTHIQTSVEKLDERMSNVEKNVATILALLSK